MRDEKRFSSPDALVEYRKTAPISFRRRWFHNRLSSRVFKPGLGDSPLRPRQDDEQISYLSRIIFACPDLDNPAALLLLRLRSVGISLNSVNILRSTIPPV